MPNQWRQGRRCATCADYIEEDGWCRTYLGWGPVPVYPGFDELDRDMATPLDCWTHKSDYTSIVAAILAEHRPSVSQEPVRAELIGVIPARRSLL